MIRIQPHLMSLVLGVFLLGLGCGSGTTQADAPMSERTSKISPELIALYKEYSSHLASGSQERFRSNDPLVRTFEGRVIIEAVAAGETAPLQADLMTLGMQNSASFGRMVSGQLPIASIPDLANLPSLIFARAALAITQKDQAPRLR
jgi:hypothetical protein